MIFKKKAQNCHLTIYIWNKQSQESINDNSCRHPKIKDEATNPKPFDRPDHQTN